MMGYRREPRPTLPLNPHTVSDSRMLLVIVFSGS